jgi:beta-1,2-mannosidase
MKKLLVFISSFMAIISCSMKREADIDINNFYKPKENPVIRADSAFTFTDPITMQPVKWQKANVFNPAAIVKNNMIYVLYRCEDNPNAQLGGRTSRLGLAKSEDGIHFTKFPTPVLYPDKDKYMQYEYPGGCEDPRLVQSKQGLYVLTYTAWDNKTARLSIAFSNDLFHWQKKGPAFAKAYGGKFLNAWSKSGSMVTEMINGSPSLAMIHGKYWMYWGEDSIDLAWSENLYDWNPMVNENGELKSVAAPRPKKFDSDLTECGPPAIITKKGIVLFYNGKNATDKNADPMLPRGTYSTGQIVFDKDDPQKVIERSDTSFLKPSLPHELTGQYTAGTTFTEALVFFKGKWFLYYGTADSFVGVAVSK